MNESEELIQKAIAAIRLERRASIGVIQRRLKIGHERSKRILSILESRGVVGPPKGKPWEGRQVLIECPPAQCASCRFYRDSECRRHSPTVVYTQHGSFVTVFPSPQPNGWCGDHEFAPMVNEKHI